MPVEKGDLGETFETPSAPKQPDYAALFKVADELNAQEAKLPEGKRTHWVVMNGGIGDGVNML